MKIPKYTSTTRMGTEPGSINLQIQQDPNASSLGARSQIGFGQNVAQLGQQVFTLGAKLQEIKNNTEASRINNEYTKATAEINSFVPYAPPGFDVNAWSLTEKAKLKNALLRGQSYEVSYPVGSTSDPNNTGKLGNVYNVVDDGAGNLIPNAIVKNNAVKKAVATNFALTDTKNSVELQGMLAKKLFNEQVTILEETQENLEEAFINGDINALYDLFGSEEVLNENGDVVVAQRNGLFADKLANGFYGTEDGLKLYTEELEQSQINIADALVLNASTTLLESSNNIEDRKTFNLAKKNMLELYRSFEDKTEDGQYTFLPHIKGVKRQQILKDIYTDVNDANKKVADNIKNATAIEKAQLEELDFKNVTKFYGMLEPFMDIKSSALNPNNDDPDAQTLQTTFNNIDNKIRQARKNNELTKESEKFLLGIWNSIQQGDVQPSNIDSLIRAEELVSTAFDVEDLRENLKTIQSLSLNPKDTLAFIKRVNGLIEKSPSAKLQDRLIGEIKSITAGSPDINMSSMPDADRLTSAVIIKNFVDATSEALDTGMSVERGRMLELYDEAIADFIKANSNTLEKFFLTTSGVNQEIPIQNPFSATLPDLETIRLTGLVKGPDGNLKYANVNLLSGVGIKQAYEQFGDTLFSDMRLQVEQNTKDIDKDSMYTKIDTLEFLVRNSVRTIK